MDKVNDISAPATTAGIISGNVIRRKHCMGDAPRSRAASKILQSIPCNRERTMIATKPIQNVVCAIMIDTIPSVRLSICKKNNSNDTPSNISGIATGENTITGNTFSL